VTFDNEIAPAQYWSKSKQYIDHLQEIRMFFQRLGFCLLANALFVGSLSAETGDCNSLLSLSYPDVIINEATPMADPVAHCKAKGTIGGNINFSLWLPETWNGRFVMGGAGGFVGEEDNQAIRFTNGDVLRKGYATASTDTGHQGEGLSNEWGLNNYEAIVNYAYLAMHRAVVSSKAVIADHYGRTAEKSFFLGCSNGGRQALHEAQKYPHDFDAIIAGAPALNFSGVAGAFLAVTEKMYPDPYQLSRPLLSPADRQLLRTAILEHCDALDGLSDGILHDPTACDFKPSSLVCQDGQEENCLSVDKVAAIETIYTGPKNDSGSLFFGFPYGAENIDANGWGTWLTGGSEQGAPNAAYAFGTGMMRNFVHHDPNWTYASMDWNAFPNDMAPIAHMIDARDTDLSEFREQGGKLLMFHGWSDMALTAHMSTDYADRVYARDASAEKDLRLFMLPGVLHCFGGPGPSNVDWLDVLEQWHDSGTAPQELAASYPDKPGNRKVCAWPAKAVYQSGDPESARSYRCVSDS
jgi:hypothetical protein